MHTLRVITSVFVFAFCFSCSSPEQKETRYSKATEDTIKMVENNLCGSMIIQDSVNNWNLQQRMTENKIHGLSIAVIRDYKLAWTKCYGFADTATSTPVTPQTLFQAASISKSLNGVGVLKLVQDKKADLYADINTYLVSWKFPYDNVSHGKKISLANLLSHTAGLTVHGFGGYEPGEKIPTVAQILDGKNPANSEPVRLMMEPGLRSVYSGGGTTISQMIVTDITKQPYDVYMQQVLRAMDMTQSSYQQPLQGGMEKYLATGYRASGEEVKGKHHIYPEEAAAGLWTNPTDLAKYIIETQLSLQGKSNKVLSAEMTRLRLTPYIDSNAALGVFITTKGNEKYFGYGGANEGFRCQYYGSFDGGNGVVVMINSDNGGMLDEIVNSVAKVYSWKDFYTPKVKKTIALDNELLKSYLGDYLLGKDTLTITADKGRPSIIINHSFGFDIYFSSPEVFFSREIPFDLNFEKDEKGKVTGIYFEEDGKVQRAKKI